MTRMGPSDKSKWQNIRTLKSYQPTWWTADSAEARTWETRLKDLKPKSTPKPLKRMNAALDLLDLKDMPARPLERKKGSLDLLDTE